MNVMLGNLSVDDIEKRARVGRFTDGGVRTLMSSGRDERNV